MRNFQFSKAAPHVVAIAVFFLVTVIFFNPVFFGNKAISQGDITQFLWSSKELRDYRAATGEEGLWAGAMFSGMPAYLINLDWSDGVLQVLKKVIGLFLPHPIINIFVAFVSYYVLLLAFRIRPFLAIAGALAFGLSSYMIIGLAAGHNARIGAIAFMPLVMAGIHLAFCTRRLLGFGVTALGLSLHLRENHAQITYYLLLIVLVYGLVYFIYALREEQLAGWFKSLGVLVVAAIIAAGTFFGPLWAVTELTTYSTRGKSELTSSSTDTKGSGLPKSYAFQYSNGIGEPITALIPEFYGGSSFHAFVNERDSKTYQALVQSGSQEMANQLAQYTSSYWGDQPLSAPYYQGAIIVFLFVLGCLVALGRYVWWLLPVTLIGIVLSWGSNFQSVNYFLFDYLPGYNKFRSVTFSMVMVFFAMPLLGLLAVERIIRDGLSPSVKKRLLVAFGLTGGVCLFLAVFAGIPAYVSAEEQVLPQWFLNALRADRQDMMQSDAFRSFGFIAVVCVALYFEAYKKISALGFFTVLALLTAIDVGFVDKRYFTEDNYQRKRDNSRFEPSGADQAIMADKSYYRVFNLQEFYEARTANFHQSLGGYSGVRLKRYQELYDSAITAEHSQLIQDAQRGALDFDSYGILNMLNAKYFVYGPDASNVIVNPAANGIGWFVQEVVPVNSANEELKTVMTANTKTQAVIDVSKFEPAAMSFTADSAAAVTLIGRKPSEMQYETRSAYDGLVVFSEIYYPAGWTATIDGQQVPIMRANYVLRALQIPAGVHSVVFSFKPKPYTVGDNITMISSWLLLIVIIGSVGWTAVKPNMNE